MTIKLKADKREVTGRKVKRLRSEGIIPANVYGKDVKSSTIQVDEKEFTKVFKEAGETGLIDLTVGKEKKPVLVHDVQVHPVTEDLLHVDFLQVNLKEKVKTQVPVELIGESPADKSGLGTLVHHLMEVEVEALPTDLPEKFEVDVSGLEEVDSFLTVADIKTSGEVTILDEEDKLVAKVDPLREEEEIEVPETDEESAEGEEKAEGSEEQGEGEEKAEEKPQESEE